MIVSLGVFQIGMKIQQKTRLDLMTNEGISHDIGTYEMVNNRFIEQSECT